MASPNLAARMKSFAKKISGTSTIDNGNDPTSAAFKMRKSIGKPNPNDSQKPFKPTITPSNGIGVGA